MGRFFQRLKTFPHYPLWVALYPALALYAANASQVAGNVLWRPLLVSLAVGTLAFLILRVVLRTWERAALLAALLLLFFFSYGQIYDVRQDYPAMVNLLRHRYLAPGMLVLLALAAWGALRLRNLSRWTPALNLCAIFLVLMPTTQALYLSARSQSSLKQAEEAGISTFALNPPVDQPLPSVYFIVLDGYMRSDNLLKDLGYDNSGFVQQLEEMGFYVPPCSRSNYGFTIGSLLTAFNMDYLDPLQAEIERRQLDMKLDALIKYSRIRRQLETLGYRTVAFDSGYEWSRLYDAEVYLAVDKDAFALQSLSPFEAMLIKSTTLRLATDYTILASRLGIGQGGGQYREHIELERFILKSLPGLASDPLPKFVFAHILIPHFPHVFLPDGSVRTDPAFNNENLSDEQRQQGYRDSIGFLNNQIVPVLRRILDESSTPPVIVVMSDHGLDGEHRFENFTALYLPQGREALYPAISPVNYFRLALNGSFGARLPLLPDLSYVDIAPRGGTLYAPIEETNPGCGAAP
jgi:hypothetical protein